jgi:hypothetical protein
MTEFLAALHGDQGELDAFLETQSEEEIKELVLTLLRAERERSAKICDDAKPTGGRAWTAEQAACYDCLSSVAKEIRRISE